MVQPFTLQQTFVSTRSDQPMSGGFLQAFQRVDDHIVRKLLEWITPMEIPVGPSTMTLSSAEFTDGNDNVNVSFLQGWSVQDLRLIGVVAVDCGIMGTHDAGVNIVVDITNPPGEDPTRVDVKDLQFTENDGENHFVTAAVNKLLTIESIRQPVCDKLEGKINGALRPLF